MLFKTRYDRSRPKMKTEKRDITSKLVLYKIVKIILVLIRIKTHECDAYDKDQDHHNIQMTRIKTMM